MIVPLGLTQFVASLDNEFLYALISRFVGLNTDGTTVKQFIRNVRASKTSADERAVVQKESAAIRASFREESSDPNVRYEPSPHMQLRDQSCSLYTGATMSPNCYIYSRWENELILDR